MQEEIELSQRPSYPTTHFELVEEEPQSPIERNVALVEDIPPNGGYGWVCTTCLFMINAHTWGINSVRSTCGTLLIQIR
jgi:hypothetical protein